jgi:hypothetical protein
MSLEEILNYLIFSVIIISSIIIGLIIAFIYVKLLSLISPSKGNPLRFRNNPNYPTGNKRQYTDEPFNFIIFLKCIYYFTHLHCIWDGIRYSIGILNTKSPINAVNTNKENKSYAEYNQGIPKSELHTANTSTTEISKPTTINQNRFYYRPDLQWLGPVE